MHSVRPANASDIPPLYELWYDRIVLEQQQGRAIQLAPDASAKWQTAAQTWLNDPQTVFLVVGDVGEPIGCIVVQIAENQPGVSPEQIAVIRELVVDLHTKQGQGGIGKMLLEGATYYLRQQKIEKISVVVSHQSVVEQAFWRGMGATHIQDIFEWEL